MKRLIKWVSSKYLLVFGLILLLSNIATLSFSPNSAAVFTHKDIGREAIISGKVTETPKVRNWQQITILSIDESHLLVMVNLNRFPKVEQGDLISCRGFLETVPDLNYYKYLGVGGIVRECVETTINKKTDNLIQQFSNFVREKVSLWVNLNFNEPHASLLLGMLIGSNLTFSNEFNYALLASGAGHIVAVSGYNINIVTEMILLLVTFLPRKIVILFCLPLLTIYLSIVGFENIPALRAFIFNTYQLVSLFFGRKADPINSLGVSLIIIGLILPMSFLSLSFQLSFAAIIGMLFIAPYLKKLVPWDGILISFSCFVSTSPIILLSLGEFYPWALLANLLITPILPVVMDLVLITIPLALVFPNFSSLFCLPLASCLNLLVEVINQFGKAPYGRLLISSRMLWMACIVLIITTIIIIKKRKIICSKFQNLRYL